MNNAINTQQELENARRDAQSLAKRVQGNTEKSHTAIRAEARTVAAEAERLGRAIQNLLEGQAADARQHLKDALTALKALDDENQRLADAEDADIEGHNEASFARAREAAHKVSEALAAKRALAVHA